MTPYPSVLVVEDDAAIRDLLVTALGREPLRVDTAADGAEALEKLAGARYAVLLLDLMLPRVSGYALLEILRARQTAGTLMVIVMTAFDDAAIRALDAEQVHACIRKPFDLLMVSELVRDCAQLMQAVQGYAAGDERSVETPGN